MKLEEKKALVAAGATILIGGAFSAMIATPVAWAATVLAAYRMGKSTYDRSKSKRSQDQN